MEEEELKIWKKMDMRCKSNKIIFRKSSHGLWLSSLLFIAFLQTILRNPLTVQLEYELITVILFGMMLQSIEIFVSLTYNEQLKVILKILFKVTPTIILSAIINQMLGQDITFSFFTASALMSVYNVLFVYLLKSMPHCFTFGEGTIVTQAIVVFLYNCFLKVPTINKANTLSEQLNIILHCGLLGVTLIITIVHFIPFFRRWFMFYPILLTIIMVLCLIPVGDDFAAIILWKFIFGDTERTLVSIYMLLSLAIVGFIVWMQLKKNQKGTTATRKIFHVLIVLVYVPGLIYQCYCLFVASVIILAVLITLELARIIKLCPVSDAINTAVAVFIDEQDAGNVALTPIYLLVGCSLPLWIHNSPCDLTNSSGSELLLLLSGIISIGIGDTFASVVGSKIGKHKWNNSKKSIEGTVASILAQSFFIYLLYAIKLLNLNKRLMALCGIAVISNALIEAFTFQVDNLVLPIVTYIILGFK